LPPRGFPVVLHICGQTARVLDPMAESGAALLSLDDISMAEARDRVGRALRDGGASPILHICGDLGPILPQVALIARNLDAPLALSVDAMVSGRDLKAALPEVVRVGNVDALLLQREDAAMVERVARAAARDFDVLSPACGLVPTTPAENLQALVRAAQR
jgi:uroporphyrinogen-III decarboxylase